MATSSLPAHLSQTDPAGLVLNQPVAQYELGELRNFIYLIIDWKSGAAAIVDPQRKLDGILADLREHGLTLRSIFLTHTHHDHVAGVPGLLKHFPDIKLYGHSADFNRLDSATRARPSTIAVGDGEEIAVGELKLRILHTPGHSAGEISLYVETPRPYVFTGDTVFIRDCGRTDFATGSNPEMFASIQRIKALAPETVILPGHHYAKECATTVARELLESPPFKCKTVEELAALP